MAESGEGETDSELSAGEADVVGTTDVREVDVAVRATWFSAGSSIRSRLLYMAKTETTATINATKASIAAIVLPEPDLPERCLAELAFLGGLVPVWCGWCPVRS